MDLIKLTEKLMSMDDETWARHSNPWSVYSRFTILPLMSFAFYSREWIGIYSILPISLSILWIWINPRLFGVPSNTDNWASMGTYGERLYLDRKANSIPEHHKSPAILLQVLSGLGLPIFIYGLYSLNVWAIIVGNLWVMVFKAWFVDRMVWLYLDMRNN